MRCLGRSAPSLAITLFAAVAHAQPTPFPAHTFDGRVFPSHWARAPLLDQARVAANVDQAWERFGMLGRGATVCVVDTGVDLTHRDLRDAADHTRVDWLLDLDRAPRGAEPELEARFGGAVFRGDELDAMLAAHDASLPSDWHGHGTAIASAAVGDDAPAGIDTPGAFAGVAPQARLVVVRALRRGTPGFADADIARGAAFCAAVVDPAHAVVVLSLGGHDGAHDGTSAIETSLAELVHAGLTIVVAAGNDGGRAFHSSTRVAEGNTTRLTLRVPSPEATSEAHVTVAVRGASRVALALPDTRHVRVDARGDHASLLTPRGTLTADASRPGIVDLTISGDAMHPFVGGEFLIEVTGPAHADAWIVSSELGSSPFSAAFVGASVVSGEEITMPATSDAVISVGASVSRPALVTTDGSPTLTLDADEEGRAIFSSRGPTASGALAPSVLAPGGWIVAARSSAVDPGDPEALVHGRAADWSRLSQPDDRLAIAGTSVSAALVAGALALAVEAAPLDPERDRDLLAFSAMRDRDAAFTPARGFGAIDVFAFLSARAGATTRAASSGVLSASRAFTTPGASDLSLALLASAGGAIPEDAWIDFRRDGTLVARAPLRAGVARAHVEVGRAVPGEWITWSAWASDGTHLATSATRVALDDDGADAIGAGSASCSVGTTRARAPRIIAIALLAALLRKRSSRRARDASTLIG